jgi:hypothetical protein
MKKAITGLTAAVALAVAVPASANSPATQHLGPYASNSPDSGTCGNTWANDTMNRDYSVDTVQNSDRTWNVTEEFKNGTFVTNLGPSPEACGKDPGGTVSAGITGNFHGSFGIVVSGGTYYPNATCPGFCYTADFVNAFFPGNTGYNVTTYDLNYNAGPNGDWKDASANRGGDAGDITG